MGKVGFCAQMPFLIYKIDTSENHSLFRACVTENDFQDQRKQEKVYSSPLFSLGRVDDVDLTIT